MTAFKAALLQTNVSNEMAENVAFVREQAKLARDGGADFFMTPENTGLIGANRGDTLAKAQTEETHAMLAAAREALSRWADSHDIAGDALVLAKAGARIEVRFEQRDLSTNVDPLFEGAIDLVTAAAFFDLVSRAWF